MSERDIFDGIKENLNGRPGQPIIFGVCEALAKRFNVETWITRAAAIVLAFVFTFLTLAAYIVLGFVLDETETRTRGFFKGLWISIKELFDRVTEKARDWHENHQRRHREY